jgi:hypothetical protein
MTLVPVEPKTAAAVTVAAGGSSVQAAAGGSEQQQTQVCIVANIETETHVPEAIISFVLKVSKQHSSSSSRMLLPGVKGMSFVELLIPSFSIDIAHRVDVSQAAELDVCFATAAVCLQVFAPFFYSTVLKVLASAFKPSDPLPERMAAHHELYDMIMQRCTDFLAGHPD